MKHFMLGLVCIGSMTLSQVSIAQVDGSTLLCDVKTSSEGNYQHTKVKLQFKSGNLLKEPQKCVYQELGAVEVCTEKSDAGTCDKTEIVMEEFCAEYKAAECLYEEMGAVEVCAEKDAAGICQKTKIVMEKFCAEYESNFVQDGYYSVQGDQVLIKSEKNGIVEFKVSQLSNNKIHLVGEQKKANKTVGQWNCK